MTLPWLSLALLALLPAAVTGLLAGLDIPKESIPASSLLSGCLVLSLGVQAYAASNTAKRSTNALPFGTFYIYCVKFAAAGSASLVSWVLCLNVLPTVSVIPRGSSLYLHLLELFSLSPWVFAAGYWLLMKSDDGEAVGKTLLCCLGLVSVFSLPIEGLQLIVEHSHEHFRSTRVTLAMVWLVGISGIAIRMIASYRWHCLPVKRRVS